ncbi:carbohydrate ABC transporter permease [Microvirga sp. VF16]|uniref:carbohydrate ABC transporter permease n=1 Tax=Microvirga sp. VF16 TaxID=2807101 RepID=UPI00193DDF3D|nr:sugar ABC transporter permease [Microvirga sp. VF16]QRM29206.1 sugar ABC transporter permease [Microvirga sp. VF16]
MSVNTVNMTQPMASEKRRPLRFDAGVSWWFILPALVVYSYVLVYPMLSGAGYAFTNWNGLDPSYDFVGLANFKRIFSDPQAISAISMTLVMAFALVLSKVIIGLLLALALDTQIKSRNILRLIFFMPVVLTPVIMSFSWKYIFSTSGALNQVLQAIGLGNWTQQWLGDPHLALFCVIFVTGWGSIGLAMVIFLAGLQNVPKELVEAAKIDGAGGVQRLVFIILPLLAPAMTINVVIALIQGLKFFDQIYVLTGGGPGYATETLSTIIYKTSFQFGEYGYGSATALVFSVLVAALVYTATHFLKKREISHG